jgi:hypothetical protein
MITFRRVPAACPGYGPAGAAIAAFPIAQADKNVYLVVLKH